MKRLYSIVAILLIMAMAGSLSACGKKGGVINTDSETKGLFQIIPEEILKISIRNGNTGQVVFIDGKDEIGRIVDDMNKFRYSTKEEKMVLGYPYRVTLYADNDVIISDFYPFPQEALLRLDGWEYTSTNSNLIFFDVSYFEKFF